MAVSRRPRRVNPIIAGLVVLAIGVLVLAGVLVIRSRITPPPSAPEEAQRQLIEQKTQQIVERLDVLIVSHYTEEVIQDGKALLPNEYQAARQNLQQINQLFQEIQPHLEAQQTAEIKDALETLQKLVENKRPPAEVKEQAEVLIKALSQASQ